MQTFEKLLTNCVIWLIKPSQILPKMKISITFLSIAFLFCSFGVHKNLNHARLQTTKPRYAAHKW